VFLQVSSCWSIKTRCWISVIVAARSFVMFHHDSDHDGSGDGICQLRNRALSDFRIAILDFLIAYFAIRAKRAIL